MGLDMALPSGMRVAKGLEVAAAGIEGEFLCLPSPLSRVDLEASGITPLDPKIFLDRSDSDTLQDRFIGSRIEINSSKVCEHYYFFRRSQRTQRNF